MRFETAQHARTAQQMRLAPRVIQSMEILQLPLLALEERIEQELESNLALELDDGDGEADGIDETSSEDDGAADDGFDRLEQFEAQSGTTFGDEAAPARRSGERDAKLDAMANIRARGESLVERLRSQWAQAEVDEEIASAGDLLLGFIDADGLLTMPAEDLCAAIAADGGVTMTVEQASLAIDALQQWLDPRGMAARSTRECLLLQADELAAADPDRWSVVRDLVADHFEDLVENRLPLIASATGRSIEEVKAAVEAMHDLVLWPGRMVIDEGAMPVIPDAVIEFDEQRDRYIAGIRDGRLPALRVSRQYEELAADVSGDEETRTFVRRNLNSARWIIDAVHQRRTTLLRVLEVVVDRQRDFLERGEEFLRPLPMVETADRLGIHVATVSRAVADKWVQTPRGTFRLRRFFSGGTDSDGEGRMSWEAVKARLRAIVEAEDRAKPLSDEAIATKLGEQGIEIARRTVVKYRQQLDIPAARHRREY